MRQCLSHSIPHHIQLGYVIQGLLPDQIKMWISLPTTQEVEFAGLVKAVQTQYLAVSNEISCPGDAWTTVLHYINMSKG
jgi:hypothetical protein